MTIPQRHQGTKEVKVHARTEACRRSAYGEDEMTITCKGAVLRTLGLPRPYAESRPLAIEDITLDPPRPA